MEHGALRAADILEGLTATDTRELSGIFSTADSVLAAYRSDAALTGTRNPTFDPAAFAASTDTLYLVAPAATQALMAPLVVALLDQVRSAVYRWRPRTPMLYALDEVANIAPLPDLPSTLAEGGSQGLLVLACLQDLSQARARWGKAADGFLTLFTHKLLLPGVADPATLKAISTLAGHVEEPVRSRTTGWTQSSTSWTTRRQPRLPEDRIANLPIGTGLLVNGSSVGRVAV
jgi:type IV secretion system protein VirD4